MKLSIAFTLLLAMTFRSFASSSLTAEEDPDLPPVEDDSDLPDADADLPDVDYVEPLRHVREEEKGKKTHYRTIYTHDLSKEYLMMLLGYGTDKVASSSLTAKDSSTVQVSRLDPSQEDALKTLALDDETHKRIVDRVDLLKVTKFMELHELFKKENVQSTLIDKEEVFNFATAYVPCEIAWHLRIIEFDETVQCLEKSASWKARTKVGDQVLVNFFADKHAFELIQLLKTTDVGDEELFLNVQKLLSSEGFFRSASTAFFLQHALALYKQNPTSSERQEMVKNFLSLHLSALAEKLYDQAMLKALYTELVHDVPTLFYGGLPRHAIAVVATRKKDEYDIVIINSGDGIQNHESTTAIQPKGFHTGASYGGVPAEPDKLIESKSFNPLLRMEGVSEAQLASAHYHYGTMDQVYYVKKNASSRVVTEPLMPWEWTEAQGIGTCTATSVWFALRFYHHALGYANEIRLSMLDQAIGDLKELQDKVEGLERQMSADYQKLREEFRKTNDKTAYFPYDQDRVKDLKLKKDEVEKSLNLRRTIISMALNEILRNVIAWHHELSDINAGFPVKCIDKGVVGTVTKDKDDPEKTVQYRKMEQRRSVLEKAIPQSMASFHGFWALQEEKYLKRQSEIADTEAELSSVLDSWQSIRGDVRTMYNDAIRVTKMAPKFATALAKPPIVKQTFKPINVASLKEHISLRRILSYITNFGDSPALHSAISDHLKAHKKNANATKHLIVLYACLAKNVPLLSYLVVEQKLPLRYKINRKKRKAKVSMYWDLKTKRSIAALAAHEFAQYGQPLDAFPELFRMSKEKTQGIVDRFKDAYKEIAPIITAEAPSQDDVDKAFEALASQGRIAAMAYILPRTSKKAIGDAFIKTDSVRVLRLLIDLVQDPELLTQKIEASITNVEIVELVLPVYLRSQRHGIEKEMLGKQRLGLTVSSEPAKVSLPDRWLKTACDQDAVEVVELLVPFTSENIFGGLLLAAAKAGKSEMTQALAKYASKRQIEASLLVAAEQGDLTGLEKRMPSVSTDAIGCALSKAAERGKMDCFGKLVPHSTDESIRAAILRLSDENLKHPSVLRAVNNASRLLVYKKVVERATAASSAELVVHMLPFMTTLDINALFTYVCKNAKSFEITKQIFKFANKDNVGYCLEAAVNGKMENQVSLLLPRVKRERLAEISRLPEFKELSDDTRKAAANRIKNFPAEAAIELAFLPKDKDAIRASLEKDLGEDDLACNNQETCIDTVKTDPAAMAFPVEQAIGRLLERVEDRAALEKLAPFATSNACTAIIWTFSDHGSEEAVKACAEKVLRTEASRVARSARRNKNFESMKLLVPFLSPLGIVEFLEPDLLFEQVDAAHLKDILAGLPEALADAALHIGVRRDEGKREKVVHDLLPKASQAAIDEVYLFAKRIKFDDKQLEKAASGTAKAQGKEIERGAK